MAEQIIKQSIWDTMAPRYLTYAKYSIKDRALADDRDGLKPVGIRGLYTMHEMGLKSSGVTKKSARVVGNVIGYYHPHGDISVYEALVRFSQPWSLRYPLVFMQGNNGSRDGDSPAAMRYTEMKMTPYAEQMLKDINKNTVDYKPNYDDTEQEPVVLPSLIPNLLANGTDGIAVGMASSIPPHNLTELYDACLYMIENVDREIQVEELFNFIKGPDFPDGGVIVDTKDLAKAYTTGRGKVVLRSKYEIETIGKHNAVVISQIPYQVNKEKLVNKIDEYSKSGKIEGIKECRDESNKKGVRIVIELKRDANTQLVINKLLKHTDMQTSVSFNMMALHDEQPVMLTLKDALESFLAHCVEVITRRTTFDKEKAEKRIHLIDGILTVLTDADRAVHIIRNSETPIDELMEAFEMTREQAEYVYEMKVKSLSRQSEEKLNNEKEELLGKVAILQEILDDETVLLQTLSTELTELKEKFGDERRTEISVSANVNISEEDLVKDENLVITITSEGLIKSVEEKEYNTQKRGGKGSRAAVTKDDEVVIDLFTVNSKDDLLFITNQGRCHTLKAYKIPKASRTAKGKSINNFVNLLEDEWPVSVIATKLNNEDNSIVFITANGTIKRLPVTHLSSRMSVTKVIGLNEGDELISALIAKEGEDVLICTALGQGLRTTINAEKIRPMGRSARGVKGIKVKEGDVVIGMTKIDDDTDILTVSCLGLGKRTKGSDFPVKNRGGQGVKAHKVTERTGALVACLTVNEGDQVFIGTESGQIIRLNTDPLAKSGRDTTGNKLINLTGEDQVVTASLAPTTEEIEDTIIEE